MEEQDKKVYWGEDRSEARRRRALPVAPTGHSLVWEDSTVFWLVTA